MSSKKSQKRAARKEMIRRAELVRKAEVKEQFKAFWGWMSLAVLLTGALISWLCSFAIEDFSTSSAIWCSVYAAAILFVIWIHVPSTEQESESVKKARLLKEAKEKGAVNNSCGCMSIGGMFLGVGFFNFLMLYNWNFNILNLERLSYLLGMIAWTFAGGSIVLHFAFNLIKYKKVLAEEAAGARFVELPPDEGEEELARLMAEEEGVPFTTDSHPNNMDAENDYIDDPDYDYGLTSSNGRRVPTFALDSHYNNTDAENDYIDDPHYDRGQNRYNCHRSPAPRSNSRRSNSSSHSDDSFYDEIQY